MPNWCNNNVTITSPNQDKLKAISKAAAEGKMFEFMHPMPAELRDTTADGTERPELVKKYGSSDWYGWANQNWSTKWDNGECYQNELQDGVLHLAFDTAWGPPIGVYDHYTHLNNDIDIKGFYFEGGCDFMGVWHQGEDECYQTSEITDSELEGSMHEFDDLYNILEHRAEYREDAIRDGDHATAKEWLMKHQEMSEEKADEYINDFIVREGVEQVEKEECETS